MNRAYNLSKGGLFRLLIISMLCMLSIGCVTIPKGTKYISFLEKAPLKCSADSIDVKFSKVVKSAFDYEIKSDETASLDIKEMKERTKLYFSKIGFKVNTSGDVSSKATIRVINTFRFYSSDVQKGALQISHFSLGIIPVFTEGRYFVEIEVLSENGEVLGVSKSKDLEFHYLNGIIFFPLNFFFSVNKNIDEKFNEYLEDAVYEGIRSKLIRCSVTP